MNSDYYHKRLKRAGITSKQERELFIKFLEAFPETREQRRELFEVLLAGIVFELKLRGFRNRHPELLRDPERVGGRLVEVPVSTPAGIMFGVGG